jgi:hypothetical protein
VTQFWPEGALIQVEADSLWTPLRLTWQEEVHPVEQVNERWRVDEEWWRGRVWREYFILTTSTGLLVELFHDLLTGEWYVQRVYD